MKLIDKSSVNYGLCLIDIYRASGDLYSSWDIVPYEDGKFSRLPDARYGVNQPVYSDDDADRNTPLNISVVSEIYDNNGHTVKQVSVYGDGKYLAGRTI